MNPDRGEVHDCREGSTHSPELNTMQAHEFRIESEIQVQFVSEISGWMYEALLQFVRNAGIIVVDGADEVETLHDFQGVFWGEILDFPEFSAIH